MEVLSAQDRHLVHAAIPQQRLATAALPSLAVAPPVVANGFKDQNHAISPADVLQLRLVCTGMF